MEDLDILVKRIVDQVRTVMNEYHGEPGSITIGRVFMTKPTFEMRDVLAKVQQMLPKCGIEVVKGITRHKSIYTFEWKVYF